MQRVATAFVAAWRCSGVPLDPSERLRAKAGGERLVNRAIGATLDMAPRSGLASRWIMHIVSWRQIGHTTGRANSRAANGTRPRCSGVSGCFHISYAF